MTATTTMDEPGDVDRPADRDQLLGHAARNGADENTLRALRSVPPETCVNFQGALQSVPLDRDEDPAEQAARRRTHPRPGLAEQAEDVPPNPLQDQ
jgi:hypothetical protein